MKALTLTQPWATLVALRAKRIETRSWPTSYRGQIAIHAGAGLGPVGGKRGLRKLVATEPFHTELCNVGKNGMDEWWGKDVVEQLPLGAVVAIVRLVDCVSTDLMQGSWRYRSAGAHLHIAHEWMLTDQERAFGDYSPGRYAWLLDDIQPMMQSIPARGALGLWEWTL